MKKTAEQRLAEKWINRLAEELEILTGKRKVQVYVLKKGPVMGVAVKGVAFFDDLDNPLLEDEKRAIAESYVGEDGPPEKIVAEGEHIGWYYDYENYLPKKNNHFAWTKKPQNGFMSPYRFSKYLKALIKSKDATEEEKKTAQRNIDEIEAAKVILKSIKK